MTIRRMTLWFFILGLILAKGGMGSGFPLEPPDTTSPQKTLAEFLRYSDMFAKTMREELTDIRLMEEARAKATHCFDLSRTAPTIAADVGLESVLRLREILDRLDLPEIKDVPDKDGLKALGVDRWRIPHTEIVIARVAEGPRMGAYLFTAETVGKLDEYYQKVRHLPYRDGAVQGIYEEYIYSSGWMIPDGFIGVLPAWLKTGYLGQALWQWIGMVAVIIMGCLLLWALVRCYHRVKIIRTASTYQLNLLLFPVLGMCVCLGVEYIINTQINITGKVMVVTTMWLEASFLLFLAWGILIGGNIAMYGIIASRHIKEEALNADFIKLMCRLVSFGLVFFLFYRAGSYFGLPVTAVFASAGIAGVAVALAARETLANFFGGISILMDRPFRAGDYIVLDTGERGEVKAVGMRSTRLLTRDDILITIPNSVITNVKVVNQSAPFPHLRVRIGIGVAYGSDLEKVERILVGTVKGDPMVMEEPAPRARLRTFNDSSIDFELLVWAKQPHDRGKLTHEISKRIYNRFNDEGVEIPCPQRDVRLIPSDSSR